MEKKTAEIDYIRASLPPKHNELLTLSQPFLKEGNPLASVRAMKMVGNAHTILIGENKIQMTDIVLPTAIFYGNQLPIVEILERADYAAYLQSRSQNPESVYREIMRMAVKPFGNDSWVLTRSPAEKILEDAEALYAISQEGFWRQYAAYDDWSRARGEESLTPAEILTNLDRDIGRDRYTPTAQRLFVHQVAARLAEIADWGFVL